MYKLYDFLPSGNGYKVRLTLTQLGIPYEYQEVDILTGESRTPEFLSMNPNGKIPLLKTPETTLSESNAILLHLAEGTRLIPEDKLDRARVYQWLFWEQYSHEPFIATSRFWLHYADDPEKAKAILAEKKPGGLQALKLMDEHLENRTFFVAESYSIADIALYAYTHVADEGGFPLEPYPNIQQWLTRVAAQADHITIQQQMK